MSSNHEKKITVLHIAGTGRNGSTLLERMLNELPGFFAAGEIGQGGLFYQRRACLCGKPFNECHVWKEVLADDDFEQIDRDAFLDINKKYNIQGTFKTFMQLIIQKKQNWPDDVEQYLTCLQVAYSLINRYRGCQIITDSTPLPLYGYYLSQIPSVDLYIVHLVREPRGFAHSHTQTKVNSKGVPWNPKIPPIKTALTWMKRNLFIEFLFSSKKGKYLRVHYENLIENPKSTIQEIGKMLGIQLESIHFINGNQVKLGEHHLSWGNLNAISKGEEEIVLKTDERWKRDMRWWNVILVTLITGPLLLKYLVMDKIMRKNKLTDIS